MKTQFELINAVLDDPSIDEKSKEKEREKHDICLQCPMTGSCWDCGSYVWWEE